MKSGGADGQFLILSPFYPSFGEKNFCSQKVYLGRKQFSLPKSLPPTKHTPLPFSLLFSLLHFPCISLTFTPTKWILRVLHCAHHISEIFLKAYIHLHRKNLEIQRNTDINISSYQALPCPRVALSSPRSRSWTRGATFGHFTHCTLFS